MAKSRYTIVDGYDKAEFEKAVREYLDNGYKIAGPLTIGLRQSRVTGEFNFYYLQAVV